MCMVRKKREWGGVAWAKTERTIERGVMGVGEESVARGVWVAGWEGRQLRSRDEHFVNDVLASQFVFFVVVCFVFPHHRALVALHI